MSAVLTLLIQLPFQESAKTDKNLTKLSKFLKNVETLAGKDLSHSPVNHLTLMQLKVFYLKKFKKQARQRTRRKRPKFFVL
jgi:hypothetical protein